MALVRTRIDNSTATELYDDQAERDARLAAIEQSGRKPVASTGSYPAGDGNERVTYYEVRWYEPRGGDPDRFGLKELENNPLTFSGYKRRNV